MRYYGLVDEIKHESGIYGRKEVTEKDLNKLQNSLNQTQLPTFNLSQNDINYILKLAQNKDKFLKNLLLSGLIFGAGYLAFSLFRSYSNTNQSQIKLLFSNKDNKIKSIIITNDNLDNNYYIENNLGLFYGLFDKFSNKNKAFETIMKSGGGSEFIILEKDNIPSSRHYGGIYGKFSTGIYFEHPKNSNILLPLENSKSLIKDIILEETLRIFEALGAKQIVIEDYTEAVAKFGSGSGIKNVGIDGDGSIKINILKRKEFGKGVFDPQRCMNNLLFVPDFPNIMTVINSRIYGNLIKEEFTETINLSAGLDIGVINLLQTNFEINTTRRWHFSVEFYDKNEMKMY